MATVVAARSLFVTCMVFGVLSVAAGVRAQPQERAQARERLTEPATPQTFYRYEGPDGRTVYTNVVERVPVALREQGRMDLQGVSLNTELGRELDRQLAEQHKELVETPYCRELREAADTTPLRHLWDRYAVLLIGGGLLLLLALLTPAALRRFGAPAWARVLTMVVPALSVIAGVGFGVSESGRAVSALKRRAEPCQEETFAKLSRGTDPISAHTRLVTQLQREIDALRGHNPGRNL